MNTPTTDAFTKIINDKKNLQLYWENPTAEGWEKIKHLRMLNVETGKCNNIKPRHEVE